MSSDESDPLLPAGVHVTALDEVRALCVEAESFAGSPNRAHLFRTLAERISELRSVRVIGALWINGSFLTAKLDPRDVDVCLRIQHTAYDNGSPAQIAAIDTLLSDETFARDRIDGYLLVEYPANHPNHDLGAENLRYWLHQFGKSRSGVPKGIAVVELG